MKYTLLLITPTQQIAIYTTHDLLLWVILYLVFLIFPDCSQIFT